MNWDGPTSWCAATGQFAVIGHWCVVRLPSVGGMRPIGHASLMPEQKSRPLRHPRKRLRDEKKIRQRPPPPIYPRWPKALRAVRGWLAPIHWLTRYWQAFFNRPPPDVLVQLISALKGGRAINLYFST